VSTARYLALIADAIETVAGSISSANAGPSGYWKRIVTAAEDIAGAATSANDDPTGYMKRAALAIVARTGFTPVLTYNAQEEGYLAMMVDALEFFLSTTTTGSWEKRLYDLLLLWSPGVPLGDELLLSGDMQSGTDYVLLSGDMQSGTDHIRI